MERSVFGLLSCRKEIARQGAKGIDFSVKLWFDAVYRSLEKIPLQSKFELGQACYLCSKHVGGGTGIAMKFQHL